MIEYIYNPSPTKQSDPDNLDIPLLKNRLKIRMVLKK